MGIPLSGGTKALLVLVEELQIPAACPMPTNKKIEMEEERLFDILKLKYCEGKLLSKLFLCTYI